MTMNGNKIIAKDEKAPTKEAFLKAVKGMVAEPLQIGDVVVGEYIVERKEINDLIHSALKGNLNRQLTRIVDFCNEHPSYKGILLVEGWKLNKHNYQTVKRGVINKTQIITSVMEDFGIFVMQTQNMDESIEFVKLLNIINTKTFIPEIRGYKRKLSMNERIKFVLLGFETVGITRASNIMEEYITLMEYFNYVINNKQGSKVYNILMSEMSNES